MNVDFSENIPRICTAVADWMACIFFLQYMKRRFENKKHVVLCGLFLPVLAVYMQLTEGFDGLLFNVFMLLSALIMLVFLFCMSKDDIFTSVYFCSRAFILAGFSVSFFWQTFVFYFARNLHFSNYLSMLLCMIVLYLAIFGAIYLIELRRNIRDAHIKVKPVEAFISAAVAYLVYVLSSLSYTSMKTPFSGSSELDRYNIRTMVYLAGVAIQTAYFFQQREYYAEKESAAMRNMLKMQYNNYRIGKESIDIVNQKYHDLKHQIAALRAQTDPEKAGAYLDKLEAEIKSFEAQNKTGNEVLDIILTTKALQCQKNDIQMSVVADGKLLSFMDEMDISTIFGNAIDNAIESVQKISDKNKRLIHVAVSGQKSFLHINVINCFEGEITMEGGLPKTTKKNKEYHGFGLKGIKETVLKYDGSTTVKAENGWFELRILIPNIL